LISIKVFKVHKPELCPVKINGMLTEQFIQGLIEETRKVLNQSEKLNAKDLNYLTWKSNTESWSILECLEHLNLYGDYYLPEIRKAIRRSTAAPDTNVKPGWLGNYFAKSMLPKEKLNKMKTFKDKDPMNLHAPLTKEIIAVFIGQQHELLELLNEAKGANLNRIRIKTSISPLLRLKLGDTFHFVINHIIRHMAQIERVEREIQY